MLGGPKRNPIVHIRAICAYLSHFAFARVGQPRRLVKRSLEGYMPGAAKPRSTPTEALPALHEVGAPRRPKRSVLPPETAKHAKQRESYAMLDCWSLSRLPPALANLLLIS